VRCPPRRRSPHWAQNRRICERGPAARSISHGWQGEVNGGARFVSQPHSEPGEPTPTTAAHSTCRPCADSTCVRVPCSSSESPTSSEQHVSCSRLSLLLKSQQPIIFSCWLLCVLCAAMVRIFWLYGISDPPGASINQIDHALITLLQEWRANKFSPKRGVGPNRGHTQLAPPAPQAR